ncbi:MAG: hypothetical protein MZU95_10685 [Desulfomicrobium escambiense]|nr:hypothetical protein [Desulfomicrobium escambiense]
MEKQPLNESVVKDLKRVLLSCMELNKSSKALLFLLDEETGDFPSRHITVT